MEDKFIHYEGIHNLISPREIVPKIVDLIKPKSVVDFGCGLGTFLYTFKENGITDVLGLDGTWVDKNLQGKYLNASEFMECDLEKTIDLKKKYDLVITLEVAEHLAESAADTFVRNLTSAGQVVLFSAAIPMQGGQNHINEQWLAYWEDKFKGHGYKLYDIVRPMIWDNPKVSWWYKQNAVLFIHKDYEVTFDVNPNLLKRVIHYDQFKRNMDYWDKTWEEFYSGKMPSKEYLKLYLKSIIGMDKFESLRKVFGSNKN